MSKTTTPEATYAATFGNAIDHLSQAGNREQQRVLRDLGWTMLEVWTGAEGRSFTRLSNAWLGERKWRVQIAPARELWRPEWVAYLADAAKRRGHDELLGTSVSTVEFRDRAVWRIPTNADDVSRFFESQFPLFCLLFPADRSFAIHCIADELAAYAGPADFVRDALPPGAIGRDARAAAISAVDPRLTEEDYADVLAPYAPFMIDG